MHISAYRGYATRSRAFVSGRVLDNCAPSEPRDEDNLWDTLRNAYRRFETDEVPNAPVTIRFEDQEQTVVTDADGYYHF